MEDESSLLCRGTPLPIWESESVTSLFAPKGQVGRVTSHFCLSEKQRHYVKGDLPGLGHLGCLPSRDTLIDLSFVIGWLISEALGQTQEFLGETEAIS